MDIEARKLSFVQEFLRISDEELISKLEGLLHLERKRKISQELRPMTMDEFNKIIEQSEEDFKNGRATEARDILNEIEKWK